MSKKFANKVICREIEIRGDQTLEQLHYAIFKAYDRWDQHLYEFQFGKRPFDPDGPNYAAPDPPPRKKGCGNARAAKLDDLDLKPDRVFGTGSTLATTGIIRFEWSESSKPFRPLPIRVSSGE
ncbi:MAG: hypothetical protein WD738_08770 [Pirellulales bacterium]